MRVFQMVFQTRCCLKIAKTADVVREQGADFGVAFDGDFDRCFLFDEEGAFVPEYVIGRLAAAILQKSRVPMLCIIRALSGTRLTRWKPQVVYRSCLNWSRIHQANHAEQHALYGGEMSAHHYFRDFAYCDSGMIPWLLIWELISTSGKSLGEPFGIVARASHQVGR